MYRNTQQFTAPECYPSATIFSSRERTMWVFTGIPGKRIDANSFEMAFWPSEFYGHLWRRNNSPTSIYAMRVLPWMQTNLSKQPDLMRVAFDADFPNQSHSAWLILHPWERALCECGPFQRTLLIRIGVFSRATQKFAMSKKLFKLNPTNLPSLPYTYTR